MSQKVIRCPDDKLALLLEHGGLNCTSEAKAVAHGIMLDLRDCRAALAAAEAKLADMACELDGWKHGFKCNFCVESAAALAAHDAEVGLRVVSECAMTMRSRCSCSHCDENEPGWKGREIVERALAAQEVTK